MKHVVFNWIGIISSVLGITSFALLFAMDKDLALIALLVFIFLLLIVSACIVYKLRAFLNFKNPEGYSRTATFIKYEMFSDGKRGVYESYRTIRCEKFIMPDFTFNFQWTGSKQPTIKSHLQTARTPSYNKDRTVFDSVTLVFPRPLIYGDTTTIHFAADFDDIDGSSKPIADARVDSKINIIHFRIILNYKPSDFNKPAMLKRKKINAETDCGFEYVESVEYKKDSRSYEYHLAEPEVGYTYRIEWEK